MDNEINQIKKLMETLTESYSDNNTYDNDSSSGMADDTRMMFSANERPEVVLAEVSRILQQFGVTITIVEEEGSIYGRVRKG